MLNLTSTSDLVRVTTDAATDIEVHASWCDYSAGNITPSRTNTASITTATTTTVVASPAASTQRNVKFLSIKNNHAATSCGVSVDHTDGSNAEELMTATLLAGEALILDDNGDWTHCDSNGAPYPFSSAATQAQMEAGSVLTRYVSPGRQQFHPASAKMWATLTTVTNLAESYNISSVSSPGAGRTSLTIATDFASADWCAVALAYSNTTGANEFITNIDAIAAGSVEVGSRDVAPGFVSSANGYGCLGFGDQA